MQLKAKPNHLESEKNDVILLSSQFIDDFTFEEEFKTSGRPKFCIKDILKCLIIMNFHTLSYRRSFTDFMFLKEKGIIKNIPKKSTLCRYMNSTFLKEILENLIQSSATCFRDVEETFMMDSSQFLNKLLVNATQRIKKDHKVLRSAYRETRKLHICIAKNSKVICVAKTSNGKQHDSQKFEELFFTLINNKFYVKKLLCDSAYNSKAAYSICEDHGVDAFLDFKSNSVIRRSQGIQRKEKLIMYRTQPKTWKESYSYRCLVEMVFSNLKKKSRDYLRGLNETSQDSEMLLKCLWYNIALIAKYMDNLNVE